MFASLPGFLIALSLLFGWLVLVVFGWCLCRVSAQADERDRSAMARQSKNARRRAGTRIASSQRVSPRAVPFAGRIGGALYSLLARTALLCGFDL